MDIGYALDRQALLYSRTAITFKLGIDKNIVHALHMLHKIINPIELYIHYTYVYNTVIMGGWVAMVRPLSAVIHSLSPLALTGSVYIA